MLCKCGKSRAGDCGGVDIYEPVEVLRIGYMEEVVCNGDDLILNSLFHFEPMEVLEHCGDVRMFGSTGNVMHIDRF